MKKISEFLNKKLHLSAPQFIISLVCTVLGLILLIAPGTAVSFVFNSIGGLCIGIGILNLIRYFSMDPKASIVSNALTAGIILILGGFAVILLKGPLVSIIPIFFGVILLISGIGKLQGALSLRRMNAQRWYFELIFAAVSILFGALILFNPFSTSLLLMRIIGLALLIEGLSDIISFSTLQKKKTEYLIEVEMKDVE